MFFGMYRNKHRLVIAGLDPAIHDELPHALNGFMDARVKPAHDGASGGHKK
jgi:hypothetical protein